MKVSTFEYAGQGLEDAQEAKAKSEITSATEAIRFIETRLDSYRCLLIFCKAITEPKGCIPKIKEPISYNLAVRNDQICQELLKNHVHPTFQYLEFQ